MNSFELLAVIILAGAILILIYYYLQNNPRTSWSNLQSSFSDISSTGSSYMNLNKKNTENDGGENTSDSFSGENLHEMGDMVKGKFKGVSSSTDNISNKIDKFLDEKSEVLISDWSLATLDDISSLEEKFDITTKKVDDLEDRFNNFESATNDKFDDYEARLKNIEDKLSDDE